VQTLLHRVDTGKWSGAALQPSALNSQATGLGATYNVFQNSMGKLVHTPPQFISYVPAPYLRPFDAGDQVPGRS
jgi:hypothetical protein